VEYEKIFDHYAKLTAISYVIIGIVQGLADVPVPYINSFIIKRYLLFVTINIFSIILYLLIPLIVVRIIASKYKVYSTDYIQHVRFSLIFLLTLLISSIFIPELRQYYHTLTSRLDSALVFWITIASIFLIYSQGTKYIYKRYNAINVTLKKYHFTKINTAVEIFIILTWFIITIMT